MTTEKESWIIRMQLKSDGVMRTISKNLSYDEMISFLAKVNPFYYGHVCPRIWGHNISEGV